VPLNKRGPLAGCAALVTGASRGIGLAVARALVGAGARTFCLARSAEVLARETAALGSLAEPVVADLGKPSDVDRALDRLVALPGGAPDILVQNAGLFTMAPVASTPPDAFAEALAVNLVGPYRLLHALVAPMRRRGSGHVVTIGSIADRVAFAENVAYAASKFGARAVHEVLRVELGGTGVRVSLVSPGPVDTTLWDAIDPDSRADLTPRARMLRPEHVAAAVLFTVTCDADANVDELRLSRA
jgi:NAD(P)-dependent dehydrogenase (short-subunit alcohol dehydrogenase family)